MKLSQKARKVISLVLTLAIVFGSGFIPKIENNAQTTDELESGKEELESSRIDSNDQEEREVRESDLVTITIDPNGGVLVDELKNVNITKGSVVSWPQPDSGTLTREGYMLDSYELVSGDLRDSRGRAITGTLPYYRTNVYRAYSDIVIRANWEPVSEATGNIRIYVNDGSSNIRNYNLVLVDETGNEIALKHEIKYTAPSAQYFISRDQLPSGTYTLKSNVIDLSDYYIKVADTNNTSHKVDTSNSNGERSVTLTFSGDLRAAHAHVELYKIAQVVFRFVDENGELIEDLEPVIKNAPVTLKEGQSQTLRLRSRDLPRGYQFAKVNTSSVSEKVQFGETKEVLVPVKAKATEVVVSFSEVIEGGSNKHLPEYTFTARLEDPEYAKEFEETSSADNYNYILPESRIPEGYRLVSNSVASYSKPVEKFETEYLLVRVEKVEEFELDKVTQVVFKFIDENGELIEDLEPVIKNAPVTLKEGHSQTLRLRSRDLPRGYQFAKVNTSSVSEKVQFGETKEVLVPVKAKATEVVVSFSEVIEGGSNKHLPEYTFTARLEDPEYAKEFEEASSADNYNYILPESRIPEGYRLASDSVASYSKPVEKFETAYLLVRVEKVDEETFELHLSSAIDPDLNLTASIDEELTQDLILYVESRPVAELVTDEYDFSEVYNIYITDSTGQKVEFPGALTISMTPKTEIDKEETFLIHETVSGDEYSLDVVEYKLDILVTDEEGESRQQITFSVDRLSLFGIGTKVSPEANLEPAQDESIKPSESAIETSEKTDEIAKPSENSVKDSEIPKSTAKADNKGLTKTGSDFPVLIILGLISLSVATMIIVAKRKRTIK